MYGMSASDVVHRPPGCGIAQTGGVLTARGLGRIEATSNAGAESVTGTCATSSVLAINKRASAARRIGSPCSLSSQGYRRIQPQRGGGPDKAAYTFPPFTGRPVYFVGACESASARPITAASRFQFDVSSASCLRPARVIE